MRFVVDKVALRQVCLPVLVFSPASIITPAPLASSNTTVFRRASGQNLGTFEQTNVLSNIGGALCTLLFACPPVEIFRTQFTS